MQNGHCSVPTDIFRLELDDVQEVLGLWEDNAIWNGVLFECGDEFVLCLEHILGTKTTRQESSVKGEMGDKV